MKKSLLIPIIGVLLASASAQEATTNTNAAHQRENAQQRRAVADKLQSISVTIQSGGSEYMRSEGSGVIVTRLFKDGQGGERTVSFIWTAAHVVDGLRSTRTVIDPSTGTERTLVEFKDAGVLRELVEDGRRVGETKMDAKVIRYSDADNGQDLALLMVRKKDFNSDTAVFYLDAEIPSIGTPLLHVGSLLGQMGSNSLTAGVMSQIGRTIGDKVFDQTTVTAFPGSSGGGVFLEDGRYMGMVVRGAGEGFNLTVPVRRMVAWAKTAKVLWAIDPSVPTPTLTELENLPVEEIGVTFKSGPAASAEAKPTPQPLPDPDPDKEPEGQAKTQNFDFLLNVVGPKKVMLQPRRFVPQDAW